MRESRVGRNRAGNRVVKSVDAELGRKVTNRTTSRKRLGVLDDEESGRSTRRLGDGGRRVEGK